MAFEVFLESLSVEKVLDVATGRGGFIHTLKSTLGTYQDIVGIDSMDANKAEFEQIFMNDPSVRFMTMDAEQMTFPDNHFDLVTLANSIHHFKDPAALFSEMRRVVRPNGHLLIMEMFADQQTQTQMTHVLLHHWWAAIDRARGIAHQETFPRQTIIDKLATLKCETVLLEDYQNLISDPQDPERLDFLNQVIDRYQEFARPLKNADALTARGEALRKRTAEVGFHGAAALVWVGQKPVW